MPMSFVTAMLHFFGKHPNQTTQGFAEELKALTPEDRAYFRAALATVGYEIKA